MTAAGREALVTTEELAIAVARLSALPARERERECVRLTAAARSVLAAERAAAVAEIDAEGRGALAAYARELGVTRSKLDDLLKAHRDRVAALSGGLDASTP